MGVTMSRRPSTLAGRRRLWLWCALFAGRWFANAIRDRRWNQCLARTKALELQLWKEFQIETFKPADHDLLARVKRATTYGDIVRQMRPELIEVKPGAKTPTLVAAPMLAGMSLSDGLRQYIHHAHPAVNRCGCGHNIHHELSSQQPYHRYGGLIRSYCGGCGLVVTSPFHPYPGQVVEFDTHVRAMVDSHCRRLAGTLAGARQMQQLPRPTVQLQQRSDSDLYQQAYSDLYQQARWANTP